MSLPLLERATEDGLTFVLTPRAVALSASTTEIRNRMPDRAPVAGEQYRFHFDMGSCIGCKSCVVACNEQNGNPAAINWRRVGEIEGGWYPQAQRSYLSMGCNHCLEPTCLEGCPVDAYSKDPATGIVLHSADTCIGCQYCTWNCSYGVPQYNPERGVVGKCDMCRNRLELGQSPACVSACPTGAPDRSHASLPVERQRHCRPSIRLDDEIVEPGLRRFYLPAPNTGNRIPRVRQGVVTTVRIVEVSSSRNALVHVSGCGVPEKELRRKALQTALDKSKNEGTRKQAQEALNQTK
jgi:DMSO reductase iron-sulfur subunit